jgi:hypothetical protein
MILDPVDPRISGADEFLLQNYVLDKEKRRNLNAKYRPGPCKCTRVIYWLKCAVLGQHAMGASVRCRPLSIRSVANVAF